MDLMSSVRMPILTVNDVINIVLFFQGLKLNLIFISEVLQSSLYRTPFLLQEPGGRLGTQGYSEILYSR